MIRLLELPARDTPITFRIRGLQFFTWPTGKAEMC